MTKHRQIKRKTHLVQPSGLTANGVLLHEIGGILLQMLMGYMLAIITLTLIGGTRAAEAIMPVWLVKFLTLLSGT